MLSEISLQQDGGSMYVLPNMRDLQQADCQSQRVEWRLLGAGGRGRKWGNVFHGD